MTVAQYLYHWLEAYVDRQVAPRTAARYRGIVSTASIQTGSSALAAMWRKRWVGAKNRSRSRIASGRSTDSQRIRAAHQGTPNAPKVLGSHEP
jgi:hypothetical protein